MAAALLLTTSAASAPAQASERAADQRVARPALASFEVVLQIGVASTDPGHGRQRRGAERRAPEVGVNDHAGRVDCATQRGLSRPSKLFGQLVGQDRGRWHRHGRIKPDTLPPAQKQLTRPI